MEKQKRRRKPGGGRKPGEFGKLGAVMGLRLPEALKEELEQAAEESGRTLSGEMIWQLQAALTSRRRDRELAREKRVYQGLRNIDASVKQMERLVLGLRRDFGFKSKDER